MSDRLTQAQQRLQRWGTLHRATGDEPAADACDLGAQCVALVQALIATNPMVNVIDGCCHFCSQEVLLDKEPHTSECLYQQARQLTEGE